MARFTQVIQTAEYNAKMKSRGFVEGEIVWNVLYKEVGDPHAVATLILIKKDTQKKMLGLYSSIDYADMLRAVKTKAVPGISYKDLGDGVELLVYPGGVAPGKQAFCTIIPAAGEFDLIIGASDQSKWANKDKDFEKRFIELAGKIYKQYKK